MASRLLLLTAFVVALLLASVPQARAFGAGDIASFSYLEGKAFRHGDIESIIGDMAKKTGGGFLGIGGSTKFTSLDVKRIYFGNWLRDYSQAVDIATLKKTSVENIINLLMVMGFMTFGYVTGEFEITAERLGCYLPVEHCDNPKGYGGNEDPRKYHPKLRPPVDQRELQIDPRTGMKNYMANENGGWDTTSALIRRTIESCIHLMRQSRSTGRTEDEYEAYRLLGSALHQLEDFTAHSNYCELTLISLGYTEVFPHVGENARVRAPNGKMVHPLVTGTFGGADFMHSLLGEAGDKLSQTSVSDLNKSVQEARSNPANSNSGLRSMLFELPGSDGKKMSRDMDDIANSRAGDPNQMSYKEIHDTLWKVLSFRDNVMKGIENTIDRIPGLSALVEKITNSLNVFVFTTIEPYIGPVLKGATGGLANISQELIDDPAQLEVFTNPNADDPTHSYLSKDHFGLILNEPAGLIAQIIIRHAVDDIVRAWDDTSIDPRQVANKQLEAYHHPDFASNNSNVQREMREFMQSWIEGQGQNKREVLNRLTKNKVQDGENRRIGSTQKISHDHGGVPSQGLQGVLGQHNVHVPGAQYLNMGEDLLAGKMPGSAGFGSSQGQGRWRGGVDDTTPQQAQYGQQPTSGYSSYEQPSYPTQSYDSYQQPHHQQPHHQQPHHQQPQYQQPSHDQYQQPSYEAPTYGGGNSYDAGGGNYSGPPPQHHQPPHHQPPHHQPPHGEFGGPPHHGPGDWQQQQPSYGQPGYGQQPGYGGQPGYGQQNPQYGGGGYGGGY